MEGRGPNISIQEIQLDVADRLDPLIADELRLQQILGLLLCNALYLVHDSGEIGLKVEPWDQWLAFTVWDTGVVIPPHQQHLVFQTPLALEGLLEQGLIPTGLSLILAQQLAHLQGGDITFLSQTHTGNQFTLLMPPIGPQGKVETHNSGVLSDRLILVVAAAPLLLSKLYQILTDLDYLVVIAHSCAEAFDKCQRLRPQLIFLHLPLPSTSGRDVLSHLKHQSQKVQVPIVVLGDVQDKALALQKGASDFLCLPVTNHALEESVRTWLSSSQLRDEDAPLTHQTSFMTVESRGIQTLTALPKGSQRLLKLTVLHLDPSPSMGDVAPTPSNINEISNQLHRYGCRVIAVDDLEQAELLTQIWQPKVILYTSADTTPLKQLSHESLLAELPFVVLNQGVAKTVSQTHGITVFMCPLSHSTDMLNADRATTTLLQTLQTAAGVI